PLTPPKEGNKNMPPKEVNKKTPPREANNSPPSEGSGVVSYRLAKRSINYYCIINLLSATQTKWTITANFLQLKFSGTYFEIF
ncbi:MAG: hypothetical protein LBC74_15630, partial [Planctomycetaceae bacterium]|nr:hypothetical protein [Planctomycetaceae bacterium]